MSNFRKHFKNLWYKLCHLEVTGKDESEFEMEKKEKKKEVSVSAAVRPQFCIVFKHIFLSLFPIQS